MSHFSVMVITPTADDVEKVLAPFHEFECTGVNDEHVQDIDITEKVTAMWREGTTDRYKAPDGTLHYPYGDEFYREPTAEEDREHGMGRHGLMGTGAGGGISWHSKDWGDGRGHRAKVHFLPEGWKEVDVPNCQVMSLAEYAEYSYSAKSIPFGLKPDLEGDHKFGYALLNEEGGVAKIINRTNPNKKWDWWVVGGRWAGFLRAKKGAQGYLRQRERSMFRDDDAPRPGHFDQMRKSDVDWGAMRKEAEEKAREKWQQVRRITGGASWDSWDDTRLRYPDDIERARKEYWDQPAVVQLKEAKLTGFFGIDDDLALDEAIYVERRRNGAICTYAYLKDGQWAQRGEMGWWGMSSNEMSQAQWQAHFNDMVDGLPDDALITIVDCHI